MESADNDMPVATAEARWGARALDLAQQGYTSAEIADAVGQEPAQVEVVIAQQVPGGITAVRRALRTRLRTWQRAQKKSDWAEAEREFGIPHANVTRLVRAPEPNHEVIDLDAGGDGYLDVVLGSNNSADERVRVCARAYAMGATLQELGDRYGVTRERIRQILKTDAPRSSTEINAHLRALSARRTAEHRRAVQAWSRQSPGASLDDATRELGMSEDQILDLLGKRRSLHVAMTVRGRNAYRRSDEEILADIRRYAAETGKTTAEGFEEWAVANGVPGKQTAAIRFDTWNAALTASGVEERTNVPRKRQHTDEDLWAAVIAAIRDSDGGTSFRAISAWLAEHPAAPSGTLIRHRLNISWAETVNTVLAVIGGTSNRPAEWIEAVSAPRDWDAIPDSRDDIQHVRDAIAALGPRVSTQRYQEWARQEGRPSMPTLLHRTGKSWNELVDEAGGIAMRKKKKAREKVSEDEAVAALARYLTEDPRPSSARYPAWAKQSGAPSLATIYTKLGAWENALERARGISREDGAPEGH